MALTTCSSTKKIIKLNHETKRATTSSTLFFDLRLKLQKIKQNHKNMKKKSRIEGIF
jgi:hypothetical protein